MRGSRPEKDYTLPNGKTHDNRQGTPSSSRGTPIVSWLFCFLFILRWQRDIQERKTGKGEKEQQKFEFLSGYVEKS